VFQSLSLASPLRLQYATVQGVRARFVACEQMWCCHHGHNLARSTVALQQAADDAAPPSLRSLSATVLQAAHTTSQLPQIFF
jgi:hypothetical protein